MMKLPYYTKMAIVILLLSGSITVFADHGNRDNVKATRNITAFKFQAFSQHLDSPHHENVDKLFDGDKQSKFLSPRKSSWVKFISDKPQVLSYYTITSANDAPGRDPKQWLLEASVDGSKWHVIDRQFKKSFKHRGMTKHFHISGHEAYKYFRFHFTQSHKTQWGDEYLQLAEIELFAETDLPISAFDTDKKQIQLGESIAFVDLSENKPLRWLWTFEGATVNKSFQPNPTIKFDKAGSHKVTLTTFNQYGQDTLTKTKYIKVLDPNNPWQGFSYPDVVMAHEDTTSEGYQRIKQLMPNITMVINDISLKVNKVLYKNFTQAPDFDKVVFNLQWSDVLASRGGSGKTMVLTFSTKYIAEKLKDQPDEQVLYELEGVFWHELTHGYQQHISSANYQDGGGYHAFIEGVADLVRIDAGYHKTRTPKPSDSWLGGYTNTGFFLHWISLNKADDFIYRFNQTPLKLKKWSFESAIESVTHSNIDSLWREYQHSISKIIHN